VPDTSGLSFPEPGYPEIKVDTIFADGVTALLPGPSVVKFHLARTDGNFVVTKDNRTVVVQQVVMSIEGFIQAAQFFNNVIDGMVEQKVLSKDRVDQIRAMAAKGGAPTASVT